MCKRENACVATRATMTANTDSTASDADIVLALSVREEVEAAGRQAGGEAPGDVRRAPLSFFFSLERGGKAGSQTAPKKKRKSEDNGPQLVSDSPDLNMSGETWRVHG